MNGRIEDKVVQANLREKKEQHDEEKCTMRSSAVCTPHKILRGRSNQAGCDELGMQHIQEGS
jgi:hypothetical protein